MRFINSLIVLGLAAHLGACASVSKQCFGDGVCRTDTDGVVTWSGPPEKVAEYEAREAKQKAAAAAMEKAYADAEKRPGNEPIRLVAISVSNSNNLQSLAPKYQRILEEELRGDARIQLVPSSRVGHLLRDSSSGSRMRSSRSRNSTPIKFDEALTKRLRSSGQADVVLLFGMKEDTKTGIVRGKKGSGAVQVVNVAFTSNVSSVYTFEAHKTSYTGKSTSGIKAAGFNKGKAEKGELKLKRNPESDRPAIKRSAQWVKSTVNEKIGPSLPSMAALAKIKQEYGLTGEKNPMADQLRKMFNKKK